MESSIIENEFGKLRGVTIHQVDEVMVARNMCRLMITGVKSIKENYAMLAGKRVKLRRSDPGEEVLTYSADLTKATDYFTQQLTDRTLRAILKAVQAPKWMQDATGKIVARREIDVGEDDEIMEEVTSGALMGLGPSWAVLSFLNDFCARHSPRGSYAVCGDDLVAIWTRDEISAYEEELKKLGMEANKEKSFITSSRGVFCERLVVRGQPTKHDRKKGWTIVAIAEERMRIAEAVGARNEESYPGESPTKNKVIRKCARLTRKKRSYGLGSKRYGGGGGRDDETSAKMIGRGIKVAASYSKSYRMVTTYEGGVEKLERREVEHKGEECPLLSVSSPGKSRVRYNAFKLQYQSARKAEDALDGIFVITRQQRRSKLREKLRRAREKAEKLSWENVLTGNDLFAQGIASRSIRSEMGKKKYARLRKAIERGRWAQVSYMLHESTIQVDGDEAVSILREMELDTISGARGNVDTRIKRRLNAKPAEAWT
jgi:hypothetical protein